MNETKYCGWTIPGYPIYVCIKDEHTDEHEPKWYKTEVYKALAVQRKYGRVVHE